MPHCALQVLEKVSPNPREVKAVAANSNSSKNRSMDFLPSECVCVCVSGMANMKEPRGHNFELHVHLTIHDQELRGMSSILYISHDTLDLLGYCRDIPWHRAIVSRTESVYALTLPG